MLRFAPSSFIAPQALARDHMIVDLLVRRINLMV
jgi:hypothetical protein